jgi:hypothetical protein
MGQSKTSKYYKENPKAAEKHRAYQRELNKKPEQKKYRAECASGRKELGLKKGDSRDASHTKSGRMVAEHRSANRARNGSGNNSKLK